MKQFSKSTPEQSQSITNEPTQLPVMALVTSEQRQAVSNQIQATLQMLAEFDLKIYGEITPKTLEAVQTQGFVLQNGTVQKSEPAQSETEQTAIIKTRKASVRDQLHTAIKEVAHHKHPEDKSKGGDAR